MLPLENHYIFVSADEVLFSVQGEIHSSNYCMSSIHMSSICSFPEETKSSYQRQQHQTNELEVEQ